MKPDRRYRHILEFIHCRCAPDLLALRVFPNSKEITESVGALRAATKYIPWAAVGDRDITAVCVGDGCTPRTAALVVHMTGWAAISIDPRMRRTDWPQVRRMKVQACRAEDAEYPYMDRCIVISVHSHADLRMSIPIIMDKTRMALAVVSLPCCVPQVLPGGRLPDIDYHDPAILSEKDRVLIWKHIQLERTDGYKTKDGRDEAKSTITA